MGKTITEQFPVGEQEYLELDKKFGNLANYAGWQLIKKNNRNNHTDSHEDVAQELRIALLQAGSYYKRQVYIESCLSLCNPTSRSSAPIRKGYLAGLSGLMFLLDFDLRRKLL